jgi:MFS-type transporter involved in bile tolerance (Atg22 family)
MTQNPRIGMATVLGFFVLGGLLLLAVDEDRGTRRAVNRAV